jgi:hypothetical protein
MEPAAAQRESFPAVLVQPSDLYAPCSPMLLPVSEDAEKSSELRKEKLKTARVQRTARVSTTQRSHFRLHTKPWTRDEAAKAQKAKSGESWFKDEPLCLG